MDDLSTGWLIVLSLLLAWELFWKGWGLWRSARKGQAGWFVLILLLNTAGILPIIYLLTHPVTAKPNQ